MIVKRIKSVARVVNVEERKEKRYVAGFGEGAVFSESSLGWWIRLDGCSAICVGHEKPDLKIGSAVTIVAEWEEKDDSDRLQLQACSR